MPKKKDKCFQKEVKTPVRHKVILEQQNTCSQATVCLSLMSLSDVFEKTEVSKSQNVDLLILWCPD